ncbi:MAG: response regulator [Alphaproteobacteria bacterium]|nr:response regulator [Alphaproteobacteria bacterium]
MGQSTGGSSKGMEIFTHITPMHLKELIDHIRTDTTGWKAVDVSIEGTLKPDIKEVSNRIQSFFGDIEGAIFVCGSRKILTLGKLTEGIDLGALKEQLASYLPEYSCTINTGNITREGLEVIAIRLHLADEAVSCAAAPSPTQSTAVAPPSSATPEATNCLLKQRLHRYRKRFLVVDDDIFMRSLLTKVLSVHGEVFALDDGKDLLRLYQEKIPDVVFLDIHLPCGNGVDLLEGLIRIDSSAGVVILSADCIKDNVLLAQARGARSFVAKPFTKEKIEEAMHKCLEQAALLAR